jgi:hypothetical protein
MLSSVGKWRVSKTDPESIRLPYGHQTLEQKSTYRDSDHRAHHHPNPLDP